MSLLFCTVVAAAVKQDKTRQVRRVFLSIDLAWTPRIFWPPASDLFFAFSFDVTVPAAAVAFTCIQLVSQSVSIIPKLFGNNVTTGGLVPVFVGVSVGWGCLYGYLLRQTSFTTKN